MNTSLVILFYSQYSQSCTDLIQKISATTIDIRLLNVDKKPIRQRVLTDTRYNIRFVPTILIIHSDGNVEKYEKDSAEKWLHRLLNSMNQEALVETPFFSEIPGKDDTNESPAEPQINQVPQPAQPQPPPPVPIIPYPTEQPNQEDMPINKNNIQSIAQQLQRQREQDIKTENTDLKGVPIRPNES